ncbi:MAG: glycosyltransferase family 4 protein [Polyangiales bacterium]
MNTAELGRKLRDARDKPTLVLLSQVYVPDPAAVGQYMHEVAVAMATRGMRVIVLAADSGYDDPSRRYPRYEKLDGVHVVRLPWASFGKQSLALRLAGGGLFTCQAGLLAASLPRVDHVLVSTSPPMCALAGISVSQLRGAPLSFWAMDINPDQLLTTGRMTREALPVRGFDWLNRRTLSQATRVITLDVRMAERLREKAPLGDKLHVLPPWPLFAPTREAARQADAGLRFRQTHGFGDRRVVMYSGNLSPVHPVDTLLAAAAGLRDDPRLLFVFVGGGLLRDTITRFAREHGLSNVRLLPYQPLAGLSESLAAADLHLVSMGDAMVGIVHPSKIYSAMAAGRPVLALGPRSSHIAELVTQHELGWHVEHGDVTGALHALRDFAGSEHGRLAAFGERARRAVDEGYSKTKLLDEFCRFLDVDAHAS